MIHQIDPNASFLNGIQVSYTKNRTSILRANAAPAALRSCSLLNSPCFMRYHSVEVCKLRRAHSFPRGARYFPYGSTCTASRTVAHLTRQLAEEETTDGRR
jgi:hypothetical protein